MNTIQKVMPIWQESDLSEPLRLIEERGTV